MAAAARAPRPGRRLARVRQVATAVGVAGTVVAGTGAPVAAVTHTGTNTQHGCTYSGVHTYPFSDTNEVYVGTSWNPETEDDCQAFTRVGFEYRDYSISFSANYNSIQKWGNASNFKASLHASRAADGTLVSFRLAAF